jgi:hypothetical protein
MKSWSRGTLKMMALGERFGEVWHRAQCPTELNKKIIRTVIDEIIATLDEATDTLRFIIHWKGGTYTAFEMAKPPLEWENTRPWRTWN